MKPRKTFLFLDMLRLDFQPPDNLDEDTVQQYLERLRRGEKLQPIRVRFDGEHYWVEDGFHRVEAARRHGLKKIEAGVLPGTLASMEAEFQQHLIELKKSLAEEAAQRERQRKHERKKQ